METFVKEKKLDNNFVLFGNVLVLFVYKSFYSPAPKKHEVAKKGNILS